ncbi:MAG: NAD(P)/FAD-dependent oxidoreductase, partial [Solirubrobacterales bacterium]
LTPGALFGKLVDRSQLPDDFADAVSRYRYGPGTLMLHLALDHQPRWRAEDARGYSYVHIAPYIDDMSLAYQQAMAGLLPERPTVVVGQPTAFDPSRAPDGKHVLWVQVRAVPAEIRGDAAGEIEARDWDEVKEAYADRVMTIIDEYAPGLDPLVRARHVISPIDLERANPCLVGGDHLGGSHHLDQHFLFRPVPGYSRYRTPVSGLYMCGAGTWPGGGLGGGSGYMLGKELAHRRGDGVKNAFGGLRRRVLKSG